MADDEMPELVEDFSDPETYGGPYGYYQCFNFYSLIQYASSENIVTMNCVLNKLTDFYGLPKTVQCIFCSYNRISSFKGLHQNVKSIDLSNNRITSLNQLSDYVPNLKYLNCSNNNISTISDLIGLPDTVKTLHLYGNPIYNTFKLRPQKIVDIVRYLNRWLRGLAILQKLRLHYQIHKWWMTYWHHQMDAKGYSRFIKYHAVKSYNKHYLS